MVFRYLSRTISTVLGMSKDVGIWLHQRASLPKGLCEIPKRRRVAAVYDGDKNGISGE